MPLPDRAPAAVRLSAGKARLLLVLDRAMREDADLPWPARGWRRPEALAAALAGEGPETPYPVEAQTIRAYLSQLQRAVREAVHATARDLPPLLEHRRGLGVRLATTGIQIMDRARRGSTAGREGEDIWQG